MSTNAASKRENANLEIWSRVEKTNPQYTRPFTRPRGHRGTAINAEYLAKRATEVFGPLGIGWGVDILDEQVMEGAPILLNGEVIGHELIHKVRVRLWYKWKGETGDVHQFGQTIFVGRDRNGLYTDEDAPKKSLTDAMVKCLSLLGFSADVYLGLYDDNKYVTDLRREFEQEETVPQTEERTETKQGEPTEGPSAERPKDVQTSQPAETEEPLQRVIANHVAAIRHAASLDEVARVEEAAIRFAQSRKNRLLVQSFRRDAADRRKQLQLGLQAPGP